MRWFWTTGLLASVFVLSGSTRGETQKPIVDLTYPGLLKQIVPSSPRVTVNASAGIRVTIAPGPDAFPGIAIKPLGRKPWDLSAFGGVRATVINTGKDSINVSLRVDNDGPWQISPFSTESLELEAGQTGEINVIFGHSYGHKPSYPLKSAAIVQLLLFAGRADHQQSFRIDSIVAAGTAGEKPPVDPDSLRTTPTSGYLLGGAAKFDEKKQLDTPDGVKVFSSNSNALAIVIPAGTSGTSTVSLKPAIGRWDLRAGTEVHVTIKNTGGEPISPRCHLESGHAMTDTASTAAPIPPGAQAEIIIPFAPAVVWQGIPNSGDRTNWNGRPNTGTNFVSDAVSKLQLLFPDSQKEQSLVIRSVTLDAPAAPIPPWLGKQPPGPGEWTKTFDDEFEGSTIDTSKWNDAGPNYYDHVSRFVKENVIVGDGVARMHYEKRPGKWANKSNGGTTEYASGFLDTFGKFAQRYGYFESRMKLPRSPGLWPAFWMMPDRGTEFGKHGDRSSTADGGMEFDIVEALTRWGPYRYNIAMHWDGYGKEHKQTGSEKIYVQPDKNGYITAGLLWTPGSASFYCNGKEVLRWEDPRISSVPSYLMFTLPSGGWDSDALDDGKLPDDFTIDYVRCWQRKDLMQK